MVIRVRVMFASLPQQEIHDPGQILDRTTVIGDVPHQLVDMDRVVKQERPILTITASARAFPHGEALSRSCTTKIAAASLSSRSRDHERGDDQWKTILGTSASTQLGHASRAVTDRYARHLMPADVIVVSCS
jgi:hypothetical protein